MIQLSAPMENDANPEFQSEPIHSPLRSRIENYLVKTYSWHLTPERIDRDFRAVLKESSEELTNCAETTDLLSEFDRSYFVEVLTSRGVLTQDEIQTIADQLESIHLEVRFDMETRQQQAATATFRQKIEHYLIQTSKDKLLSDRTLPEFQALLQDGAPSFEHLNQRLAPYSREELRQILVQRLTHRQDITYEEMGQILDALEAIRDRVLLMARGEEPQALEPQDGRSLQNEPERPEPDLTEPDLTEPDSPQPEFHQPEVLAASAQNTAPNRAGAYTWSTWEQAKWQPSGTTAQTTGTTLTWSTWEQLRSGSASSAAEGSSADNLPSETTPLDDSDELQTQEKDDEEGRVR